MKAIDSKITKTLCRGSKIHVCDNSGAKVVYFVSVRGGKTSKGRYPTAGVGDMITASVIRGVPEMRKTLVQAIVVRQKKEFRRKDGTRVKFEDNAVIVCKDEKGNPKGTVFKGPIAKEAAEKWTVISKVANSIV
jgi:large subunit ribosomal protein L14